MSVCDLKGFVEDMERMDDEDNKEELINEAKEEYEALIEGKIKEIKYVKYDDIYEELYDKYSEEYDLKRQENKWWGITITRGEKNE